MRNPFRVGPHSRSRRATRGLAAVAAIGFLAAPAIAWDAPAGSAPAPTATTRHLDSLAGVSCVGATFCFAVGRSLVVGGNVSETLTERWDGKIWATVPSPNLPGVVINTLLGVSCTSPNNCIAVGDGWTDPYKPPDRSLIERWNGKTWSVLKTPFDGTLKNVSCTSTTNCFATGDSILRWNGTTWSIVAKGYLQSVWCTSTTYCAAVGDSESSASKRWDGTAWSDVPTPKGRAQDFEGFLMYGVSCISPTSCLAVGADIEPLAHFAAMGERWNGMTWSKAPAAGPGYNSQLNGVSCPSPKSCFAVGAIDNTGFGISSQPRAYVVRWNGKAWALVASPLFYKNDSWLASVSCTSATNCFAVGHLAPTYSYAGLSLIEHWDGHTWSKVPAPAPASS